MTEEVYVSLHVHSDLLAIQLMLHILLGKNLFSTSRSCRLFHNSLFPPVFFAPLCACHCLTSMSYSFMYFASKTFNPTESEAVGEQLSVQAGMRPSESLELTGWWNQGGYRVGLKVSKIKLKEILLICTVIAISFRLS